MNQDNIVNILLKEQRLTDLLSNREVYHDYIMTISFYYLKTRKN